MIQTDWTILIPMAGAGSRFSVAGYVKPKPLIDVNGQPMIEAVVKNIGIQGAKYVFVIQKEHDRLYGLTEYLRGIADNVEIVRVDGLTDGTAMSVEAARAEISDVPLLIANADQLMTWNPVNFINYTRYSNSDGVLPIFRANEDKWGYVRTNKYDIITEIVEKNPVTDLATVGLYWWKSGQRFLGCLDEMIAADDRTKGEMYLAPSYNYAIADGAKITPYEVEAMYGLGTPEDLQQYLKSN